MNLHEKLSAFQAAAAQRSSFEEVSKWYEKAIGEKSPTPVLLHQMLEKLGFEKTLEQNPKYRIAGRMNEKEKNERSQDTFFTYARPDGLLFSYDLFFNKFNRGKFYFHWQPNVSIPEFFKNEGKNARIGAFGDITATWRDPKGAEDFIEGDPSILHAWQLPDYMQYLEERGKFQSPLFPQYRNSLKLIFSASVDHHHQRVISGLDSFSPDMSQEMVRAIQDRTDYAVFHMIDLVAKIRILQQPQWVRQMILQEPLPGTKPVATIDS